MAVLALLASVTCLATPVHDSWVRAGGISGGLAGAFDTVRGRFALRVGPMRTRSGLSQKIPWYVPGGGSWLKLTATRVSPRPALRWTETYDSAGTYPEGVVYPSVPSPPATGCWRVTMRTADKVGVFTVLVRGRP